MAENGVPSIDMGERERTYAGFVNLAKWGTISCIVIVALMAIFLV